MKHAFLLMAHKNFQLVSRLLKKLDHSDNTIYINIDSKSVFNDSDAKMLKESCVLSKVYFTERFDVNWSGYSQINTELQLFKSAFKSNYDYYHLISGEDFPTKPMSYIHDFFEKNKGCEFIGFTTDEFTVQQSYRFSEYHFFNEKYGRNFRHPLYFVDKISVLIQKILRIDRRKKYPEIVYKLGSNWCSLTHSCVEYLLDYEPIIKEMFSNSVCCDEAFVQTIIYNSPFRDKIYCLKYNLDKDVACLRSIDWSRPGKNPGAPYTFSIDDYDVLVKSENLFCRKVGDSNDKERELIEKLEQLQ